MGYQPRSPHRKWDINPDHRTGISFRVRPLQAIPMYPSGLALPFNPFDLTAEERFYFKKQSVFRVMLVTDDFTSPSNADT